MTTPSEPTAPEPPPPSGYEAVLPQARPAPQSDYLAQTYPAEGYHDDDGYGDEGLAPTPVHGWPAGYGHGPGHGGPSYGPVLGYGQAPAYGAAPGYGQAYPDPRYGQAGPWRAPVAPHDPLSVAALITGIVSVACFFVIAGPVAIGLGIAGRKRTLTNGTRGRGMAVAGTVLGSIGTAILLLMIVSLVVNGQ